MIVSLKNIFPKIIDHGFGMKYMANSGNAIQSTAAAIVRKCIAAAVSLD